MPRAAYLELLGQHPRIALALQRAKLAEEATAHEWMANIGMRSGPERMAHLLCELLERLGSIGEVAAGQYDMPLTQIDLADTLGLSSVHVNRVLQALRRDGLITLAGRRLRIVAPRQLRELAEFEADTFETIVPDVGCSSPGGGKTLGARRIVTVAGAGTVRQLPPLSRSSS
ncbi:Crp/Fnr family transcriptional regulator [Methylobacterium oryzae CBMB20]